MEFHWQHTPIPPPLLISLTEKYLFLVLIIPLELQKKTSIFGEWWSSREERAKKTLDSTHRETECRVLVLFIHSLFVVNLLLFTICTLLKLDNWFDRERDFWCKYHNIHINICAMNMRHANHIIRVFKFCTSFLGNWRYLSETLPMANGAQSNMLAMWKWQQHWLPKTVKLAPMCDKYYWPASFQGLIKPWWQRVTQTVC